MTRPAAVLTLFATLMVGCASTDPGGPTGASSTTPEPSLTTTTAAVEPAPIEIVEPAQPDESDATFDASYLSLGPGAAFPALDDPPMVPGVDAGWLEGDDIVLGLVNSGEAQAFPASQLAYHHIVNTTIAGEPYLVTY